jgi:hypothetical protein
LQRNEEKLKEKKEVIALVMLGNPKIILKKIKKNLKKIKIK